MVATQLGMELGQGEVLLLGRRIRDKLGSWLVLPLIPLVAALPLKAQTAQRNAVSTEIVMECPAMTHTPLEPPPALC